MTKKDNKRIGQILFLIGIIITIIALFLLPWVKIEYLELDGSEPPEPLIFTAFEFEKELVISILIFTGIVGFLYVYRSFLSPIGYFFFGLEITIFIHYLYNSMSFPDGLLQRNVFIGFYVAFIGIVLQIIGFKLKKKEDNEILRRAKVQNKKRSVIALLIIFIIISSGYYWYIFIKPITFEDLFFRKFEPGDKIELTGEIRDIQKYNTTYGPITTVLLDDCGYYFFSDIFSLVTKNDKEYRIGDNYQTTLHFNEYRFNKNKFVTAEELFGTYLLCPILIQDVVNSVSFIAGIGLKSISMDGEGTTQYEVITPNGDAIPLDLSVSLRKGISNQKQYDHRNSVLLYGNEYIDLSNNYDPGIEIDHMTSLRDNLSINKSIHFIDKNSNGLLDDYDILEVKIPPTTNKYSIESYLLQIGGYKIDRSFASGVKYIINWYKGQIEAEPRIQQLSLRYISAEVQNDTVDTKVLVARTLTNEDVKFNKCLYGLYLGTKTEYGPQLYDYEEKIIEGTTYLGDNIFIEYVNTNRNLVIDENDMFIIKGLKNQTIVKFEIIYESGIRIGFLEWISGYNHLIGDFPRIRLKNSGLIEGTENLYRCDVEVDYWHPQLKLNSLLRIYVSENEYDDETFEFPYHSGVMTQYNGINVTYFDNDNDSYISTDDYFVIECPPESRYYFKIFLVSYELHNSWIVTSL